MFIAFRSELGYIHSMDGNKETPPRQTFPQGPLETPDNKTELHMTFLPKSAEVRQELLTLLIAIPLSLLGTGLFFLMLDGPGRILA